MSGLKVKLLNDGGFGDMENMDFDTAFDAEQYHKEDVNKIVTIYGDQLEKAGAVGFCHDRDWSFVAGEYEIIEQGE